MIVSTSSSSSSSSSQSSTLLTSLHLNHTQNPKNLGFLAFTRSPSSVFINKCRVYSSPERSQRNPRNWSIREEELSEKEEERKVNCEVEVVSWRERRIKGTVVVRADVESVWNALTDYERLAEFVPNLISSGKIPCPHPGRIWLEQRGLQRALYWHIEARVVLDLQEYPDSVNGPELHFSMVDGDFKKFEGKWSVKSGKRSSTTNLSYEVNVIPRFNFPAIFLERIIKSDLPVNLKAVACRAERNSVLNQNTFILGRTLIAAPKPSVTPAFVQSTGALLEKDHFVSDVFTKKQDTSTSAPFPPSSPSESNHKWGVFGKICGLDKPCMVDEVHFRRFDGLLENGGVHRGVIATITVKAPVREVWNVLTAYETLPEIVPNLAISKILSRENNKVRILQEGCKGLLYMVLHARVVLDLSEKLEEEISFEQVEGDFDSFQGKWLLEQLGNHHTLLKYIVESKMHKDSFLSEAIVEEVIYEDLPSNLSAIRDYIEKGETTCSLDTYDTITHSEGKDATTVETPKNNCSDQVSVSDRLNPLRRQRVPGLQRDIEVLKAELKSFIFHYGQEGFMPMRKQLRSHGRVDIEKAITRMGGFRKIASLMNLSLAYKNRKPKGYWDNLENLQDEISRFQRSWGMDSTYMPSRKTFERAGRYDIARALEKWGGLHEVSRLLLLKVRHPNRQPNLGKDKKTEVISDDNKERDDSTTYEHYISQDAQKWITELKHLDINWIE